MTAVPQPRRSAAAIYYDSLAFYARKRQGRPHTDPEGAAISDVATALGISWDEARRKLFARVPA